MGTSTATCAREVPTMSANDARQCWTHCDGRKTRAGLHLLPPSPGNVRRACRHTLRRRLRRRRQCRRRRRAGACTGAVRPSLTGTSTATCARKPTTSAPTMRTRLVAALQRGAKRRAGLHLLLKPWERAPCRRLAAPPAPPPCRRRRRAGAYGCQCEAVFDGDVTATCARKCLRRLHQRCEPVLVAALQQGAKRAGLHLLPPSPRNVRRAAAALAAATGAPASASPPPCWGVNGCQCESVFDGDVCNLCSGSAYNAAPTMRSVGRSTATGRKTTSRLHLLPPRPGNAPRCHRLAAAAGAAAVLGRKRCQCESVFDGDVYCNLCSGSAYNACANDAQQCWSQHCDGTQNDEQGYTYCLQGLGTPRCHRPRRRRRRRRHRRRRRPRRRRAGSPTSACA